MAGNILKHLVRAALILLAGLFSAGFVAGTLDSAIPEWTDPGNVIRVAGLIAALVFAARALRRIKEPVDWNLKALLRPLVAAAIVFLASFAGHALAVMLLAGQPAATGMVGGPLDPAQIPALHFGAPLAGLALAALYLAWPWLRRASPSSQRIQ